MTYTEEKDIPGITLFIGLKKAFDTIEWDFINSCLEILTIKTGSESCTVQQCFQLHCK